MKIICNRKSLYDSIQTVWEAARSRRSVWEAKGKGLEQFQLDVFIVPNPYFVMSAQDDKLRLMATGQGTDGCIEQSIKATVEKSGEAKVCPALILDVLKRLDPTVILNMLKELAEFEKLDGENVTIEQKKHGQISLRCGVVTYDLFEINPEGIPARIRIRINW